MVDRHLSHACALGARLPSGESRGSPPCRPNSTSPSSGPGSTCRPGTMAERVERRRRDREAATDVMCAACDTTARGERGPHPVAAGSLCTSCDWHVGAERRFISDDGRRDNCAAWLLGSPQENPVGMGQRLGLRFACEVEGFAGHREPWRHRDLEAFPGRGRPFPSSERL